MKSTHPTPSIAWQEILDPIRVVCRVEPLTEQTHDLAMQIVERYGFSIYDALIIASALMAGCSTLYSEDLQDGQVLEDQLVVRNPFGDFDIEFKG